MTLHRQDSPLTDRQSVILREVAEGGCVTIEALAARFGVSAQTVRRDIIALSKTGGCSAFTAGRGRWDRPRPRGSTATPSARSADQRRR